MSFDQLRGVMANLTPDQYAENEIVLAVRHLKAIVDRPVFGCDYAPPGAGPFTPAPIPSLDVRALYEAACLVVELTERK